MARPIPRSSRQARLRRPAIESLERRDVPAHLAPAGGYTLASANAGPYGYYDVMTPTPFLIYDEAWTSASSNQSYAYASISLSQWLGSGNRSSGALSANADVTSRQYYGPSGWTSDYAYANAATTGDFDDDLRFFVEPDAGESYGDHATITLDASFRTTYSENFGANVSYEASYYLPASGQSGTLVQGFTQGDATSPSLTLNVRVGDEVRLTTRVSAEVYGGGFWDVVGDYQLDLNYQVSDARPSLAVTAIRHQDGRIWIDYTASAWTSQFNVLLYDQDAWGFRGGLNHSETIFTGGATSGTTSIAIPSFVPSYGYNTFVVEAVPSFWDADPTLDDNIASIHFAPDTLSVSSGFNRFLIDPTLGVHRIPVYANAGDRLRVVTSDGAIPAEIGADSLVRLYTAGGQLLVQSDDTAGGRKEDFTHTFESGGFFYLLLGAYQHGTFTPGVPSSFDVQSSRFWAEATLTQRPAAPTVRPDVFVDLGIEGLSTWSQAEGIRWIGAGSPQDISASPDGSVYVDYGPTGLWRWSLGSGMVQVNAADPETMVVAPDGTLYIDYGPYGLWKQAAGSGLSQINPANPQAFAVSPGGMLFVDYGPFGLWQWSAFAGISQINGADPQAMAPAPDGSLYIDYGPFGLWRWAAPSGISQINGADPQAMAVGPDGTLYVDYGPFGLWRRTNIGLGQINSGDPEGFAVGSGGALYVDYGPFGLWRWREMVGFAQLHPSNPRRIAAV